MVLRESLVNGAKGKCAIRVESQAVLDRVGVPEEGLLVQGFDGRAALVAMRPTLEKSSELAFSHDNYTREWGLAGSYLGYGFDRLQASKEFYFGVVALWTVDEAVDTEFWKRACVNARTSVERENGCAAFMVVRSAVHLGVFAMVELFENQSDFEQHLLTQHFLVFSSFAGPHFIGDRTLTLKGNARWF